LFSVLAGHMLAQVPHGIPAVTAAGWFFSNATEALLGAALLYRFQKSDTLFESVQGILRFLFYGVFLAPFLTSFFDAAIVVITRWDSGYWLVWTTRFFSNSLAVLTIVPVGVMLARNGIRWTRDIPRIRLLELLVLLLLLLPTTMFVYGHEGLSPSVVPALVYVPLPFLLWACLRFGTAGVSACGTIIAITSFHYVLLGQGPFVSNSMVENVLFLQLLLGMVIVPLLLMSAVLSERKRAEEELHKSRAKLIEAQEVERHRIARELHDDIGQRLAMVSVELHRLGGAGAMPDSRVSLRNVMREVESLCKSTRALSHGLHPAHLEFAGLSSALRASVSAVRQQTSIRIHLHDRGVPERLDKGISLCVFRVAQEALHNVVKHSRAKNVQIYLKPQEGQLVLRIVDDGIGFSVEDGTTAGLGVMNMRDRLESFGGTLEIVSEPRKGTLLIAKVPIRFEAKHLRIEQESSSSSYYDQSIEPG
jgi:signal transduction histidine kinase